MPAGGGGGGRGGPAPAPPPPPPPPPRTPPIPRAYDPPGWVTPLTASLYVANCPVDSAGSSNVTIAATTSAFESTSLRSAFASSATCCCASSASVATYAWRSRPLLEYATSCTVKPPNDAGRACVGESQPFSVEPSERTMPPTATSSIHQPGPVVAASVT